MKKKGKFSSKSSTLLGKEAEERAFQYFSSQSGIDVLARNYRTARGEIDLICYDANEACVIFIEVRSGSGQNFALCQNSIDVRKKQKIAQVARNFIENMNRSYRRVRFDAIFIEREEPYRIEHVKDIIMLV
ncbi:MAG: YraN family protein [Spirochaetota bacterium]|jgi:putative endonuclease|nr:YraN family protein [Spirochaetota bacterium]